MTNNTNTPLGSQDHIAWAPIPTRHMEPDEPKATIRIYQDSIILERHQHDLTLTTLISADDLIAAFTRHASFISGVLPDETLWTRHSPNGVIIALWRPPAVWPVALQTAPAQPPHRLLLPMPGLVFVTAPRHTPWVFAAKSRPTRPNQKLYNSPTFNTFRDGRVCPGSHKFPTHPAEIPESFFQSYFSMTGDTHHRSQKYPYDLAQLWTEIDGSEEYPLEDLIPYCTVQEAMETPA